jgi:prevent-host-death family protein
MVMIQVNIFEIKAKLSEYLDRAARGEHIVICRHNKPVAELRPLSGSRREPRPIGPLPGRPTFDIAPSFFEPLPDDELELWEGGGINDPLSRGGSAPRTKTTSKVAEARAPYGSKPRDGRGRRRS